MTLRKRVETSHEETSDEGLLYRASHGDETSFLQLYERHRDAVFRFAFRLSSSVTAAEDITQDCFLSLLKHPDRFDATRASLRTYLFAAARNLSIKRFGRTAGEVDLNDLIDEPISETKEPLREVLEAELSEVVRVAIESLPPLQREALVLFEYEELSLTQISEVVSADIGTVKARLHRARQRLKQLLAPYYREGATRVAVNEVLK
jgi:RNA polymerase sigma-70 factor (ECF subfamily)